MENTNDIKALFIVINAGFAEDIVEMAREIGVKGATILNARGGGATYKSVMGISVDHEKEMVMSLVDEETARKVMAAVKSRAGMSSSASGICFLMPVESMVGISATDVAK